MTSTNLPQQTPQPSDLAPVLARKFGLPMAADDRQAFDEADEQRLRATWGAALETDPGMRAEAEMHARALGQPVESVAENMDIARKMVKERQLQYRELRDRYPALLDRFSDVKFASVAHDDIGNLKLVEGSFDWLKRSWNAGRAQNEYGWIGTRRMLGMDSREDRIRAAVIEKRGILDGGDGWAESVVKTFSQMAGSMANSLGAGAAAGAAATAAGPYAPVASPVAFTWATGAAFITQAAAVEGGSHYNELRRQGYSHETSQVSGLGVGLINGALEAVGAKIAAAPFKAAYRNVFLKNAEAAIVKGLAERTAGAAVAGFGREYLKVLAAETATETMQEFVTMAGERIARERERPDQSPMTWAEIGTRTGDVFVQTVQAMSVLGLPGPGAQFISDSMRANQAMRGKELLEKLAKGANASELAKRSPDRFRQFVAKAAEGTDAQEMFIEPEQLRAVLEQTGVTEEQLGALVPDVVAQLEQADADGGPVSIPTDLFAAKLAKTDIGAAMIPHVKFTQTGFTVSQGEKFQADAPKMAEQASAEYEKLKADMDAVKESVREVESGLRAQLLATGKFDKRSADAAASYYGSFVALQAARAKMLPSEFAAKYPLKVVAGEAQGGALQQPDIFAEAAARLAARKEDSARLSASGEAVRLEGKDGKYAIAGKDASKPGGFRITRFDANGPVGHTETQSLREAVSMGLEDGYKSNVLSQTGPTKTDSPEFRAWFGKSAVVDEKGAPLVVYHGTKATFNTFDKAFLGSSTAAPQAGKAFAFTSSPTTAGSYAEGSPDPFVVEAQRKFERDVLPLRKDAERYNSTGNIIEGRNIDKPLFGTVEDAMGSYAQYKSALDKFTEWREEAGKGQRGGSIYPVYLSLRDPLIVDAGAVTPTGNWMAAKLDEAKSLGKDGVIFLRVDDALSGTDDVSNIYFAFRPEQIKSVNNSGAFDPANPNILKQTGMAKTDSPEFKAWFQGSRVVNETGAPLVVYHGSKSPTEDFAFDFSKIGTNGRAEGAGFYFTTDEKVASGYASDGTLLRTYLSIKKPMALSQKGFTATQLRKILMRAAEMESAAEGTDIRDGFLANYGDTYTSVAGAVSQAAKLIASDNRAVDQMGGMVGGGLSAEYVNRSVVEVTGFDGVVSDGFGGEGKGGGTIYVAFLPEQIKSVNNSGAFDPTNPNILRQTGDGSAPALMHGSPRMLSTLRAGSMLTDEPVWAAGYTTRDVGGMPQSEVFVGAIHEVDWKPKNPAPSVKGTAHAAEKELIRLGDQLGLSGTPGGLQALARAVHDKTGFDAIVATDADGKTRGLIPLVEVPVSTTRDPAAEIDAAVARGESVPENLMAARRRLGPRILSQTTKGTFDPASFTVTLTADADSSTVLHEFGHAFLTMMVDLASQQDAPAETVADVQTVLDWFGVKDVATWNAMSLAEQTPHHEAFARSFEVYLFDGKAPSEEMEGIFRRFAKWVRAAYRNIRDNVNAAYRAEFGRDLPFLTPEVRGVFDRMVASEDAIAQAEALRSMQPMFATEEEFTKANPDAGPSGWAAYQAAVAEAHELAVMDHTRASLRQMKWLTGAKSRTLKALQREGKAARAVIEEQERAKALSEPVYRVGSWLARGEMTNADGTVEVEPGPDHKLDLDAVKALVGIKVKEKAPKKVKVVADTEAAKKARTDRLLAAAKNKRKSLITRIRELGGISRHSWETSYPGERKGEYKIRGVVRGKNDGTKAFRTVGIPWENMAQILRGEGYGPQDQDPSDFSWFVDALTDATFGIQTYREYDYIQQTAAEPDARAPESPEERKARLADEKEALAERAAIQDEETFQATIDPWDLNAASPEDAIDRLGTGKYGMLRRGGLGVEEVAKMFGYDSGEQMVVALLNAKQPDSIIAERTDARMIEEHGNLVPGSDEMEAAITEALHNEARARFVATEWRHLAKAGQPLNQVRRELRASAQRQLAAMATGRISPHQFALAEANAARESMRASKAGKFDDALLWKRKQLMQGELAKQATKVRAEIDKAREDWKRFAAADSKVAETRNIDLVNAGRVLGAAYGLTKQPETAQQATIWRQAIVDTAKNHQVIGGQLQGLLADGVAPWKDVPLERFRDVAEMGSALWDLARRVNEVEANGRKVALQEASAELRAQVGTLPERAKSTKAPGGETPSGPTRWILRGWNAVASLKRMEHWARFMDGGKDGPFMAYLVQPVMRALQRYRDAKAGIIAEMHPRLMALAKASGKAWDANIDAPELGKGHTFRGIKEVVGAMMHTGSDSNRFKLLGDKVRQWCPVYDDPETGGNFVDTKNWDAFIGRMHQEGRITKEHWDYVNFVWSTYAKVLPEAQKTHKAVMGREFETIELRPVETPFGTYPGGYVPATTDRDEVSQPRPAESIEGIAGMEQNFEWSVSTGKGFTIERNPNYAQPLVLNVARQLIGIDSELRFIHLQPTIRDVLRLSRERQFADVLSAYDRDAANAIITPWLENTATQASSRPSDIPLVDTLASLLRRGTSLAALGLNFFNALIQVTGISNARGEVKGRYMRSALGLWFKGPAKAYQDAAARSDYFRQRMDAKTKVMAQDIARMGDPGFVPGLKVTRDKLGNAAFFPQRLMQGIADTVTWHAAYAQAFAEGKSNVLATSEQMEAYAVEQADSVLRRVQGSQNPEDLAAYEAGTPLAKLFTQFGSYSNTVLNQLMGAQKGSRARIALWALVMPAMIEATLRAFLSGKVDKDDDDKYLDDLALLYGKSLLRNATGLIPGAGPLVLSLGESEGSRLSATPAGTTLQSAVQGMFAAANVAAGEDLTSYQIRNLGTLLTILSGLPLSPISRALGYVQDVEDGKAEPTGPIDYGRGLVTGQR